MSTTPASETRRLLLEAQRIANEVFTDPSDIAVIAVFQRLCLETDLAKPISATAATDTAH